jgi:methyltransferase
MVSWLEMMVIIIVVQRIVELYIARRNRIWALASGAQEFGAGHYPLFFILHIAWLIGWICESSLRDDGISKIWYVWLGLFVSAQGLRYWCMVSLGRLWNTRILVIPGSQAICKGPYRYLAHPNYLAVAIELISVPLIFGAMITASVATVLNAVLLLGIRIPTEERALGLLKQVSQKGL